jgi:thiamine kinase
MGSDPTILDTWQSWGCGLTARPVIVAELSDGQTNRSYLLNADGTRLVMRLNAPAERFPGIDRGREAQIWRAASDAGLAPPLLFADPEQRFIITEYIDGDRLEPSQLDDSSITRLFALLAGAHDLDVDTPLVDYSLYIRVYWEMIETRSVLHNADLRQQRRTTRELLEMLIASKPATALCHHDPLISNVISANNKLYLLDWEYAAGGFIAMDYAVLSVDWNIEDAVIIEHTGVSPIELDRAKQLYRYICDLWQEISLGVGRP